MSKSRIDPQTGEALPVGVYRSGAKYQYRIRVTDPATGERRPEVRGGFLRPADAATARERRLVQLGQARPSLTNDRTVGEYMTAFLDRHELEVRASSIYTYRATARLHIEPTLGQYRLRDLAPEHLRAWMAALTRSHSANVAREARRLLRQVLQQALEDELVTRNVAAIVRPPRHESKTHAFLTPDEIVKFLAVADDDEHCALWYVGLLCQLRPGELSGLRWTDVDLDAATITVAITRTRSESGKWVLGDDAKRRASRRVIDVPAVCITRLREHRREQAARKLAAPPGVWREHGLVFPNRTGGILSNSTMQYRIRAICTEAGVTQITPHGLRSSGSTMLLRLGEDASVVQRRLGHTSVQTTLAHYRGVSRTEQREVADRLDTTLRDMRDAAG